MAISKVILNSDVQMDITDTTATQGQVASTAYYYGADGVKKQGSYVAPSAVTQATPTISVNTSTGLITASSTQSAGVVSAGTTTATEQLSTENGKTVTPTTSEQTAVAANKYTLGAIKVAAMPAGSAGTPTATKGTVSNHSVSVTPSVTNTTGYITGSTKTGTAVSVSASELVSGTKSISTNGTDIDVVNYAAVDVSVPTGTARDSDDVSVSGATVTVPAGLYSSQVTKSVSTMTLPTAAAASATSGYTSKATISRSTSDQYINIPTGYNSAGAYYKVNAVANGSATTPATSITANPSISVSSGGLITATASATKSVTPTVSAGYVSSGTAGTITVSGSNTEQLSTQAAQTLYPSTTDQTIASGKYLTGTQTVKGVLLTNLTAGNIKKDVVVKVGDSVDDDRITSVTGTLTEGPAYETGTYTPASNVGRPTISFANSHTNPPIFLMMTDTTSGTPASNSNVEFVFVDPYRAFGSGFPNINNATIYATVFYPYIASSTLSTGQSQISHNSDDTTDTSNSYVYYWVSNADFKPYSNSSSRYWRSGRTYKWIAVWNPA